MKICIECKGKIIGRGQLYCSDTCKNRYYRKTHNTNSGFVDKPCEYPGCGKIMIGVIKKKRFCGSNFDKKSCSYKRQLDKSKLARQNYTSSTKTENKTNKKKLPYLGHLNF